MNNDNNITQEDEISINTITKEEEENEKSSENKNGNEEIEEKKLYGCKHYKRNCEILSPCCSKWYTCRLCHDEHENDYSSKVEFSNNDKKYIFKQHKINRYEITKVRCFKCKTIQDFSNKCVNCEIEFARYYCPICKFFNNAENVKIYHCDKCKICRMGKKEDYVHCDVCCMCFHVDFEHKCLEKSCLNVCSVCREDIFSSTKAVHINKCGHHIHAKCFKKMIKSNNLKCPICSKSMIDDKEYNEKLDEIVKNLKMPEEYQNVKFDILCNDCLEKSNVKYHFYGMKCPKCFSFNTKRM